MADSIDSIKESVRSLLCQTEADRESLDASYNAISNGFPPMLVGSVWLVAAASLLCGQVLVAVVVGAVALHDLAKKNAFDVNRLRVIADTVNNYIISTTLVDLRTKLSNIPLKSLRELNCTVDFLVAFPLSKTAFSRYKSTAISLDGRDLGRPISGGQEVVPNVVILYDRAHVSLKCDFRVIKEPLQQPEADLFLDTVMKLLPGLASDRVLVEQFSSTRRFLFSRQQEMITQKPDAVARPSTETRLDRKVAPADVSSAEKQEQIRLKMQEASFTPVVNGLRETERPESLKRDCIVNPVVLEESRQTEAEPTHRDDEKAPMKPSGVLLQFLNERRRETEIRAMDVAMKFEQAAGRSVEDVSKENLGFDVLSTKDSDVRRIEVKGLAATGNVIITQNEVQCARQNSDSFWLYIIDNCDHRSNSKLYALKNLSQLELRTQTVDYEISMSQLNAHAEILMGENLPK